MYGSADTSWEERLLPQPRPRPVCLLSIRAAPPTTSLPSPVGGDKKSHTAVILSVCVLDLCCQINNNSSHFLQSRAVQSDCFRLLISLCFRLSLFFCLYNVELKKLSEFYGEKGTSPVQKAVSLAQRAAAGGKHSACPSPTCWSHTPYFSSGWFCVQASTCSPLWKSITLTGFLKKWAPYDVITTWVSREEKICCCEGEDILLLILYWTGAIQAFESPTSQIKFIPKPLVGICESSCVDSASAATSSSTEWLSFSPELSKLFEMPAVLTYQYSVSIETFFVFETVYVVIED